MTDFENTPDTLLPTTEPQRAESAERPICSRTVGRTMVTGTDIPPTLQRPSFEYHFREFLRQFQPVGHLEVVVVRDLARQAAAMEVWGEGLAALQRQRAQRLPALIMPSDSDENHVEDVSLATAVSAPEVLLSEHHAQRRVQAFYRALRNLQDLQSRRKSREQGGECRVPQDVFPTEAGCEDYLKNRLSQGYYRCPRCGSVRGHFISARRCWECAGCKRQAGLRAGTVMAGSPLSLVIWFAAIRLLLCRPTMGATELGMKLRITRLTTVRKLARKIIAAMAEENASELLAGLDTYHARCPSIPPETGARESRNKAIVAEGPQRPLGPNTSTVEERGCGE